MDPTLRPEQPADYDELDRLHEAAFGQPTEARIVRKLRQVAGYDPSLCLVALDQGQIVGHIVFSPLIIRTPNGPVHSLALAPLAVLPARQKQGIGSALSRAGLMACRSAGQDSVVVLGHPDYYPRFGFRPASDWGIKPPFEAPPEAFMAIELKAGALAHAAGVVEYPAALELD